MPLDTFAKSSVVAPVLHKYVMGTAVVTMVRSTLPSAVPGQLAAVELSVASGTG